MMDKTICPACLGRGFVGVVDEPQRRRRRQTRPLSARKRRGCAPLRGYPPPRHQGDPSILTGPFLPPSVVRDAELAALADPFRLAQALCQCYDARTVSRVFYAFAASRGGLSRTIWSYIAEQIERGALEEAAL